MLRGVTLAGLLVGCIDVHPFHGDQPADAPPGIDAGTGGDGPPSDGSVTLVDAPPAQCPAAPAYNATDSFMFENDSSGHGLAGNLLSLLLQPSKLQPISLLVGGTNVLDNSTTNCDLFNGLSSALVPGIGSHNAEVSGTVTGLVPGPGIAQMTTTWHANYVCGTATVTTTWTAFPDDRLVRRDVVTSLATAPGQTCTCGMMITSGQQLAAGVRVVTAVYDTVLDASGVSSAMATTSPVQMPACFTHGGSGGLDLVVITSAATTAVDNSAISMISQLATPAAVNASGSITYAVVPRGKCASAQSSLGRYAGMFTVTLNGASYTGPATDGIVDPVMQISAGADTAIRVTGGAPPGFALALYVTGLAQSFTLTHNGHQLTPAEGFVQPFGDHFVLWVRDGFGGTADDACNALVVHPQ